MASSVVVSGLPCSVRQRTNDAMAAGAPSIASCGVGPDEKQPGKSSANATAALCVVLLVLLGAALNNHDLITALFDAKGNVRPDHLAAILSRENPVVPFLMGLGVGFTLPLCGGLTAIRQAFRRSRLVVADFTPWRYRRFLEYAADHHLLMRVGIGYDFIDAHLRDHAAHYWRPNELPPPPEQPQSQATARPAPQQQQVMVSRSRSAPSPSRPV